MRILITNIILRSRSGTEVVTMELAEALAGRGHEVAIFSPETGESAKLLADRGVRVFSQVPSPGFRPDVIHGHHNLPLVQALIAYPDVPALFVCHDATQWTDAAPQVSRIRRYLAVDHRCADRIRRELPAGRDIRVVHNAVDLDKFIPRGPLPLRPRRALVVAKNTGHLAAVRRAAEQCGLMLDEVGAAVARVSGELHALLPQYDLVFATARSAIEALAAGCAVILVDGRGAGEMVTRHNVERCREFNFGVGVLTEPLTEQHLVHQVHRYDAQDASRVTAYVRQNNTLAHAVSIYEDLYRQAIEENKQVPAETEATEISRALRDWLPSFDAAERRQALEQRYRALEDVTRSRSKLFQALLRAIVRKRKV